MSGGKVAMCLLLLTCLLDLAPTGLEGEISADSGVISSSLSSHSHLSGFSTLAREALKFIEFKTTIKLSVYSLSNHYRDHTY